MGVQAQEMKSGIGRVEKEGYTFDYIYWNEETRALATHTHTVSDITDYTPYDDTAVLGYIATNAANIALKADATHNHDNTYAALNHNHDSSYAALNHNHDNTYVGLAQHTNDMNMVAGDISTICSDITDLKDNKADATHNHDSTYAAINHTHSTFTDITVSTINGTRINEYTGGQSHAALGTVPVIPVIKSDSVMEVGKYIDLHDTNDNSSDNTVRLTANSNSLNCNKNFVASNITSNNNTRLTACETAITTHNHDNTYAAINHNHAISDITNLQTKLDTIDNDIRDLGLGTAAVAAAVSSCSSSCIESPNNNLQFDLSCWFDIHFNSEYRSRITVWWNVECNSRSFYVLRRSEYRNIWCYRR